MDQNNNTPPPSEGMVFRPSAPQDPAQGEQAHAAQPTQPIEQVPQQPAQPQNQYTAPLYNPNPPQQGYQPPAQGYQPPQGYQAGGGGYQGGYPQGTPQQPGAGPGVPPAGYQPQGYPQAGPGGVYPPPPPMYNPTQATTRRGGVPLWLWVLLGVLVLGCVGIFVVFSLLINSAARNVSTGFSSFATAISTVTNGFEPSIAASAFSSALKSHNYDAAHSMLGPDLAKQYSVSDLQTKWKALEDAQGAITSDMSAVSMDSSNAAHITWSLNPANGRNYDVELTLQKVGQDWLITGANPALIPAPVTP